MSSFIGSQNVNTLSLIKTPVVYTVVCTLSLVGWCMLCVDWFVKSYVPVQSWTKTTSFLPHHLGNKCLPCYSSPQFLCNWELWTSVGCVSVVDAEVPACSKPSLSMDIWCPPGVGAVPTAELPEVNPLTQTQHNWEDTHAHTQVHERTNTHKHTGAHITLVTGAKAPSIWPTLPRRLNTYDNIKP